MGHLFRMQFPPIQLKNLTRTSVTQGSHHRMGKGCSYPRKKGRKFFKRRKGLIKKCHKLRCFLWFPKKGESRREMQKPHEPETHKRTMKENSPEKNTLAKAKSVKKKNSDSFKWLRESQNCLSCTSVLLMHIGTGKIQCKYLRHTIKESQFSTWALKIQKANINIYAEIRTQKENLKEKIPGAHTHTPHHTQKKKK